ncbi:MAG: VanZ family protein [Actinomycetota bacterium]
MERHSSRRADLLARGRGWLALAWALAYAYLGLASAPPVPEAAGVVRLDLAGHVAASGLLAVLVGEWTLATRGWPRRRGLIGAGLAGAGMGALIEVLQLGSSERSFEVLDLAADVLGASAGAWLYAVLSRRLSRRHLTRWVAGMGALALAATALAAVAIGPGG